MQELCTLRLGRRSGSFPSSLARVIVPESRAALAVWGPRLWGAPAPLAPTFPQAELSHRRSRASAKC